VLVSHEAPAAHPYGFSALTDLTARIQVKDAFRGHHLETIAYPDGVWHGVGLHEIFRYSWYGSDTAPSPARAGFLLILRPTQAALSAYDRVLLDY
jgi:hypothetical protein